MSFRALSPDVRRGVSAAQPRSAIKREPALPAPSLVEGSAVEEPALNEVKGLAVTSPRG